MLKEKQTFFNQEHNRSHLADFGHQLNAPLILITIQSILTARAQQLISIIVRLLKSSYRCHQGQLQHHHDQGTTIR